MSFTVGTHLEHVKCGNKDYIQRASPFSTLNSNNIPSIHFS